MKAGKYSYKELFVNRYVSQLVVPEIQRDYVWGESQLVGFLDSIFDDYMSFRSALIPEISDSGTSDESEQLSNDFAEFYRKRNYSSNIGFIYAYSDEQYAGRYFLIDGQQRVTSIFLVLLILSSRNGLSDDFRKSYCSGIIPKLDYRVRDSAQRFLYELVPLILNKSDTDPTQQQWYLNAYANDVTIQSVLRNIKITLKWIEGKQSEEPEIFSEEEFYNYLQNYTEFWYFDTNISAQGENLYIYLNARGEQIQGNENLKAELLGKLPSSHDKNKWGKKWESWQDYFWRKRKSGLRANNPNADKGFNEFLQCIAALKLYLNGEKRYFIKEGKSALFDPVELATILDIHDIENYIEALRFFDDKKNTFIQPYSYADWVDKCIGEIWYLLNTATTSWLVNYGNPKHSTETNRMVLLWGVFHWIDKALRNGQDIDIDRVFRGVRQFYLRFHNNNRAVGEIQQSVDSLLNDGFISEKEGSEEYLKERWFSKNSRDNYKIEALIWQIEDHPYNLDGSDVGAKNILHLVDFDNELTQEKLENINQAFCQCFPLGKRQHITVQSLLLYYGKFWRRKTPHYYQNYQFDEWKYLVRKKEFRNLLNEVIEEDLSVDELLTNKRSEFDPGDKIETDNLRGKLLWYDYYLKEQMWTQGNYIAIDTPYHGEDEDLIFSKDDTFHNTKGNFKGGTPRVLSDLLPKEYKKPISNKE